MADTARHQPVATTRRRRPWWLSIGSEAPEVSERCLPTCDARISSVDVYCPDERHGDFLLFPDRPTGSKRVAAINTLRGIVVALAVVAASRDNPWPIYVIAVASGCALIGLVLHATQIGRRVGLAMWLVVSAAMWGVTVSGPGSDTTRAIWTLAVFVPVLFALFVSWSGVRELSRPGDSGVSGIAKPLVAGAFATLGWWLTAGSHADRFVGFPDAVSRLLRYAGLGGLFAAAVVAALMAFVASLTEMDRSVDDLLGSPRIRRVEWRSRATPPEHPARRDMGAHVAWRFRMLGHRLSASTVAIARSLANTVLIAVDGVQLGAIRAGNWVYRHIRLTGRRVRYVVANGAVWFVAGIGQAARGIRCTWRPGLAYLASVGGAVAAVHLSEEFTHYLVDGPLVSLGKGVGWSAVAVAACFALSERLSSETTTTVLGAQLRFIERAAPDLAIFLIVVGWVVGISGSLGYGPIRVGWVTGIGTLVLIILMAPELLRSSRSERHASLPARRDVSPAPVPPADGVEPRHV